MVERNRLAGNIDLQGSVLKRLVAPELPKNFKG